MDDYDVIIIGTGAGGGTLARHLAPSGKRILLLERGDWLPREPQNWLAQDVFVENRYVSTDTWYDDERQAVPAAGPLLRRRRDEALRRRALPAARRGLRRASPPRRHLAGLADLVRRARALLHAGRADVPGARRARRGSDRAARQRALPLSGGVARAAHPAARRRPGRRRLPSVPRPLRHHAQRANMPYSTCVRCANCDGFPCPVHAKADAEVLGVRPGARAPQRHAADEREGGQARDEPGGHRGHRRRRRARRRDGDLRRRARRRRLRRGEHGEAAARCRRTTSTRTGSPTAPTRSGATSCSTTAWRCSRSRSEENPTVFQKTLGLNDFYFGSDDFDYPLGNIQMVGKSQAPMFRGEKPGETKLAPEWTLERVARARDRLLALDRGPAPSRQPGHASTATASSR